MIRTTCVLNLNSVTIFLIYNSLVRWQEQRLLTLLTDT